MPSKANPAQLFEASRTFALLESWRTRAVAMTVNSRSIAAMRQAFGPLAHSRSARLRSLGLIAIAAAITHLVIAGLTAQLAGWPALILPGVGAAAGAVAVIMANAAERRRR